MMNRSPLRPGNGLNRTGIHRTSKPIDYGRIAKQRHDRKMQWEHDHPPLQTVTGKKYYYCHICMYFGELPKIAFVLYDRYVLDHIIPKGRLSLEESEEDKNLGPAHVMCNLEKGSIELWQMKESPKSHLPNPYPTYDQYAEYLYWSTKI